MVIFLAAVYSARQSNEEEIKRLKVKLKINIYMFTVLFFWTDVGSTAILLFACETAF